MTTFKVIAVDDEEIALQIIAKHFSKFSRFELLDTFQNPLEALSYLQKNEVDLVLTDVAMPRISGMELIKLSNDDVRFIVTTAFTEYAIESFDLQVIDYLLKPFGAERLGKALKLFEESILPETNLTESFFVKEGDDYVKVNVSDIDYIEGMGDYIKIVCGKRYHMVLKSLKSIEKFLGPHQFMRIHKSYIIPLHKILQYGSGSVIVGENSLDVGPKYREELKSFLNKRKL